MSESTESNDHPYLPKHIATPNGAAFNLSVFGKSPHAVLSVAGRGKVPLRSWAMLYSKAPELIECICAWARHSANLPPVQMTDEVLALLERTSHLMTHLVDSCEIDTVQHKGESQ